MTDSIRYENSERAVQWRVLADRLVDDRRFMREGGVGHLLDASDIYGDDAVTGLADFTENVNVYF